MDIRRNPYGTNLADCSACMKHNSTAHRQAMGCGYEPLIEKRSPWVHPGALAKWTGECEMPTVCPGYTTKLPEVAEINRARFHKEKSSLTGFCGGEPSEHVQRGLEILEGAHAEMTDWEMKNPVKAGG